MTIEQTVEVPVSRRVFFDLPPELPVGRAKVELIFTPLADVTPLADAPHGISSEKIRLTKPMIDELLQGDVLRSLTGLLHTETNADEIRAERLKKHDHIN